MALGLEKKDGGISARVGELRQLARSATTRLPFEQQQ